MINGVLFNVSIHVIVIKLVPGAIRVCTLSPSICIFLTNMHADLRSSRPTSLVHSQPERMELSRQRGPGNRHFCLCNRQT